VKTSRAIAAQILRHWTLSVQEFSQRYAETTEMEPVQLRLQAASNRQSSSDEFADHIEALSYTDDWTSREYSGFARDLVASHLRTSQNLYKALLGIGIAKECARMILPLTTQTTMYLKGDIRTWIFYLQIRCDEHAQLEHRQVANAIKEIFVRHFPNIAKALEL
jgi:thymidylate synthase (FAD)